MHTIHPLILGLMARSAIFTAFAFVIVCLLAGRLPRKWHLLLFIAIAIVVSLGWLFVAGPENANSVGHSIVLLRFVEDSWTFAVLLIAFLGMPLLLCFGLLRLIRNFRLRQAESVAVPVDHGRRQFLSKALPLSAIAVGGAGTLYGMQPFVVRRVELRLKGLPKGWDGFRIGQISDSHVGAFIDPEHVARAVDTLNEAGVHLQVMTGDLIDDMERLPQTFAALARCQAKYGMLAILGNHEKYFGLPEVLAAYEKVAPEGKIRLLVDASEVITHNGEPVRIVGVDFPVHPGMRHPLSYRAARGYMRRSAEKSFANIGKEETVFCLAHHPDFFPFAADRGALLTLSGHTHGGQIQILGVNPCAYFFQYILGWYKRGEAQLYVSGGTGHWIPFRIGVPTEVTILTLRSV